MFSPLLIILSLPTLSVVVRACEGECIIGITKEFLENYAHPVYNVLNAIAIQIEGTIIPADNRAENPLDYIRPILSGYEDQCYKELETAIFPSYFHGKCRDESGETPPGCPNPDCPIVCGTPGSLVHFYPKLRRIVFDETLRLLCGLTSSDSEEYQEVEKIVLKYAHKHDARMIRQRRDSSFPSTRDLDSSEVSLLEKRSQDIKTLLRTIFDQITSKFKEQCGGVSDSKEPAQDELPNCSWKESMKKLILSYP